MAALAGKTCVVTGAGGFIGSHLTERLLAEGAQVRALVHYNALQSRGHLEALCDGLPDGLEIVAGDVTDRRCMMELCRGADKVFHLAALIGIPYSYRAPESYVRTNIEGTVNVLEACRECGVERLVHTSTSECYGSARTVPMDETHPLQGQSPYSASKIGADKMAESYGCAFDLPVITLRPFNTFGPRQSLRAIIPTLLAQMLSPECDRVRLGRREPVRDFTFVSDTAAAFVTAATAPLETARGKLYNLGTGRGVSIGELAEMALSLTGCRKPLEEAAERRRPEKSEVSRLISNPEKIQRELGWEAQVSLEEGLKKTADWLRQDERSLKRAREYGL